MRSDHGADLSLPPPTGAALGLVDPVQSESALIGLLLLWPALVSEAAGRVPIDWLTQPVNRAIYESVIGLWNRGVMPIVQTVSDDLRACGAYDRYGFAPSHLTTLVAYAPISRSLDPLSKVIGGAASRRKLAVIGKTIASMATDLSIEPPDAIDQARDMVGSIDMPDDATDESVPAEEFCAGVDSYDWLVPDLIERMERIIIVAGEAQGKSMLMRQIAVCCAYGVHPFTSRPIDPIRVLLLDLENPESLIRRKVRPMMHKAQLLRPYAERGNLRILCRPGGIDVTKRTDARWLAGQLAATAPALLVAGPLYKMFDADDKWEQGARAVTTILDDLRSRIGFSLVLETHAPQAAGGAARNLRPIGSSLWMRWPEFGISFAPLDKDPNMVQVRTWKSRDERAWPKFLQRGGEWPWTACGHPADPSSYSAGHMYGEQF